MEDITLAVASHDEKTDAVMKAQSMPALTGNGESDLHCGACAQVLAKNLTTEAIANTFDTDRRLLLQCVCGAHNLVREAKSSTTTVN